MWWVRRQGEEFEVTISDDMSGGVEGSWVGNCEFTKMTNTPEGTCSNGKNSRVKGVIKIQIVVQSKKMADQNRGMGRKR